MARVAPVPIAEAMLDAPVVPVVELVVKLPLAAAAARFTMPLPEEPGKLVTAAGTVLLP
jgi:hypothetical protein